MNAANSRMADTYAAIAANPRSTIVQLDSLLGRPTAGEVAALRDAGLIVRAAHGDHAKRSVDAMYVTRASKLA